MRMMCLYASYDHGFKTKLTVWGGEKQQQRKAKEQESTLDSTILTSYLVSLAKLCIKINT